MTDDVPRRQILSATAGLVVVPSDADVRALAERGSGKIGGETELKASGLFTSADFAQASFELTRDEFEEVGLEVHFDAQNITFSVEGTSDPIRAGALLELTPDEAVGLAGQLVRAAQAYEQAHGDGGEE